MRNGKHYSVRKYIIFSVISVTTGYIVATIILSALGNIIGFGSQGVLVMILISFPVCLFLALYGFYKGLVRHYGLAGEEKLFFGGRF